MTTKSLIDVSTLIVFSLLATLWLYFFVRSYLYKISFPWGVGIVVIGILVSGISFARRHNHVVTFPITLSFIVSQVGILWNITDIRNQLRVGSVWKMFHYIGIGLFYGFLAGTIMLFSRVPETFEIPPNYTMVALILLGIQAGIAEELLFRGYFLGYLRRYGFHDVFGNIIQALIFTVLHLSTFSDHWIAILIVFLNAAIAGYLTQKNNNLISAFVLHITFNLTVAIGWLLS